MGVLLTLDMAAVWQPDDAFFDLLRDRQVVNAMVAEVGGDAVAKGNLTEKVKTQNQIVRDCLAAGANGSPKVEAWLPGWMRFPARSYTGRGSVKAGAMDARPVPVRAVKAAGAAARPPPV